MKRHRPGTHAETCDAPGESHPYCHLRRANAAELAEWQGKVIASRRRRAERARERGEHDLAAGWDELADRAERAPPDGDW